MVARPALEGGLLETAVLPDKRAGWWFAERWIREPVRVENGSEEAPRGWMFTLKHRALTQRGEWQQKT